MTDRDDEQAPQSAGEEPAGEARAAEGPAWMPPPDPTPPAPKWLNGRAFPAVWRDTLPFTIGRLIAAQQRFPHMMPGERWDLDPEPDTDADVEQAIAAKLHLGLRTMVILAEAQLVVVEPNDVDPIPAWDRTEQVAEYAAEARLPCSPMIFDLESTDGRPVSWAAPSWPLEFDLRGALVWEREGMLCVVPYGSVGGKHPWGGTDYQAWARWVFLQQNQTTWPAPGPGDCIVRANGEVASWVDLEAASICAHQASIAYNLTQRVMRLLWAMEFLGIELLPLKLPRPERRRAQRAGQAIGLVSVGLPRAAQGVEAAADDGVDDFGAEEPCPLPGTHSRLNQAHALWHEALDAYDDPEGFVTKLNALIEALRNVTFVLQKELGNLSDQREDWYPAWQDRLKSDARLKWLIEARNLVVHQGGLETHSKARAQIVGELFEGRAVDVGISPVAPAHAVVRELMLSALDDRVRREGTLVIERRWVVDEFPNDELLELLAHCFAVLSELVADGHEELGTSMEGCQKTADAPCEYATAFARSTGRLPCMWAGREARTSRRNLDSGAPTGVAIRTIARPSLDSVAIRQRYSLGSLEPVRADGGVFERAAALHRLGRQMLVVDGEHIMISWLLRDGRVLSQQTLWPRDQREKYLVMERLAAEATRLGANELIITAEAWEAPYFERDDPRHDLRAVEREDRTETLLTHAVRRDGQARTWSSRMHREAESLRLDEVIEVEGYIPPLLRPLIDAWAEWRDADSTE
ncbi:MAG: hypothetical protein ACRDPC_07300 [Solirubrobacteraceae bacterium]